MCKHPGALRAKHLTPTFGGPACACLRVRFEPVTHPDGSKTERWVCKDCGGPFIRAEQMPGPIVPSDFPSDEASSLVELLDDEALGDVDDRQHADELHRRIQHLSTQLHELSPIACLSTEGAYAAIKEALQELDDLRLIAPDLHSLAAAAWQHIRATAPDDKQRREANAVCDKLLEGGPLWLCSPTPPAVGSGLCNVATVGIAEANRDRARMMTIGFPLWKLALELARDTEELEDTFTRLLGSPASAEAPQLAKGREALQRLTEGGDLWWLGEGDKNAQAWGLMTIKPVRCAGCGNEITPPAHLVRVGAGDERLAPMCAECWDTEELRAELAAEQARSPVEDRVLQAAKAVVDDWCSETKAGVPLHPPCDEEQELIDAVAALERAPNAEPKADGDAVSQPEATVGPSEPAPASEPPHGPLRWYETAAWLAPPDVPPGPARWYPVAAWLASCLWRNKPTDFKSEDWMALGRGAAALSRVMAYAAGCDPVDVPKESFIDAAAELHRVRVQGGEPNTPIPDPPYRAVPSATYEECSCCGGSGLDPEVPDDEPHPGWPCLSCWGTGEHRPAEPEVLAIARWFRKTLWPQHEERFRDAERGSFWWTVGELVRAALYDHRVAPPGGIAPGPLALDANPLREAAMRMVEALKHDYLPNAADHISDALEALDDALGEPDELNVLRHQLRLADHAVNALCVHAGPGQQRKWGSREAVKAYRAALPHPLTGKTLAPVLLAAGGLASVLHQPGAVGTLELAIKRCRCDSEPNSLNDLAARLLEAVLAQHKETDGESA